MGMLRVFFSLTLTLLALVSGAQLVEPVRLEINSRIDVPLYNTTPLGEKGVLVFYESNELTEEGKRKWYFNLFDTAFTEQWLQYVAVSDGLMLFGTQQQSGQTLFLFTLPESKKSRNGGYEILRFIHSSNTFQLLGGSLPDHSRIAGFSCAANKLMIGINLSRYQTDFLLYDIDQLTVRSVEHGVPGQTVVQKTDADTLTGMFLTGLKRFESGRYVEDVFHVFDKGGNVLRTFKFSLQAVYLHSYVLHLDSDGNLIVVGSYDDDESRRNAARDAAEGDELSFESKGLFYLAFSPDGIVKQKFHPFKTFSQIYKALPTDELMRARQRQARSKDGNANMDIVFQFYNPGIIKTEKGLIFAAEAFQPQYRIETRMDYDFYGRLVPYTYTIFEGYNFFSALIVSFSNEGDINWSSDLTFGNLLFPFLQNVAAIHADSSEIVAAFLNNGVLTSKVLDINGKEKGQTEQSKVETTFVNDRILEENFSEVSHWYQNYFIVKGYQKIANNRLRSDNSRKVLYLQKMILE